MIFILQFKRVICIKYILYDVLYVTQDFLLVCE